MKQSDEPGQRHHILVFPRIRAGASLKQLRLGGGGGGVRVFPRIRAGASLKRIRDIDVPPPSPRFPPHSCGGLIEASRL